MSNFRNTIVTDDDGQFMVAAFDTMHIPIEKRGTKWMIILNDYISYPMNEDVKWIHKGDERGFYRIDKLVWEDEKTVVYLA